MTIILVVSVFVGMAIGLRFKVIMILPAIVIATIAVAAVMIERGNQTWAILSMTALSAVAIQIGYLCGSLAAAILRETPKAKVASASETANAQRSQLGLNIRAQSAD